MNGVIVVDETIGWGRNAPLQPTQQKNANVPEKVLSVAGGAPVSRADVLASQVVEELLASTTSQADAKAPRRGAAPVMRSAAEIDAAFAEQNGLSMSGPMDWAPVLPEASRPVSSAKPKTPVTQYFDEHTSRPEPAHEASPTPSDREARQQTAKQKATVQSQQTSRQPSGQASTARQAAGRQSSGTIPVIHFEGVSKIYPAQPNKPALSSITMSIYSGEFIFLVGHSGSGKSTFIRLINREILATRGRLAVAGEDVIRMRNWRVPYLRRNIGCVFQDFKLLPNKTAFGNVAFALEVIGKSRHIIRTQVPEVLRLVGLEDKIDKYPDQLSGGEQQRVSIARAIVNRPPLLICDEPTGNLDPQTSLGIMRLLDRINRTGTTILVATHDREMVDSLRKRVLELENGYLVRDQDKGVYGIDA